MNPQLLEPLLAQPACAQDSGSWCARIYSLTGNDFLARYSDVVIGSGMQIFLILALATFIRFLVHRAINRLFRINVQGADAQDGNESSKGGLLRPLHERAPESWRSNQTYARRRAQRARTIGSVLRSASTLAIYGIAATLVLGELGINIGPIIASAGIIGLAIGFGAQNLVQDFLSGMFMLFEDQYGVGDVIDVGEAVGVVEAVGLRITTLRDENGTVWYARNGEVQRIGNFCQGYAVAVVDVPIARDADVKQAVEVAQRAATELTAEGSALAPDVLEPPAVLGVQSIEIESMTLRVETKVRPGKQWTVERALRAGLHDAFLAAGVPAPTALA